MPARFQTRKIGRIQEERQFTNPAVRFVRIRGRVVPIVNKKRIGQLSNKAGTSLLAGGAALAAAGGAMKLASAGIRKAKASKPVGFVSSSPFGGFLKKEFSKGSMGVLSLNKLNKGKKGIIARAAIKPVKFLGKHPGKIGLAMLGLGALGRTIGSGLEADSSLGFDILAENPSGR